VPALGIETTLVDGREPGAFAAAVRPGKTMLLLAETPSNPRLDLVDLDELGAIKGPIKVVDSTLATPLGQQPLAHGIDLALHSATKGIAGHNDATLGVIAGEADLVAAIWSYAVLHGATPSPFDALNALRGIRTLSVRTTHQSESALHLADAIVDHPAVAASIFPGSERFEQQDLAKRQMRFGGHRRRDRPARRSARSRAVPVGAEDRAHRHVSRRSGDARVPPGDVDAREPLA
jgi:cystathionine beta-lyase/cystathionine gamma-synthase